MANEYGVLTCQNGNEIVGPLHVIFDMLAHVDATVGWVMFDRTYAVHGGGYESLTVVGKAEGIARVIA